MHAQRASRSGSWFGMSVDSRFSYTYDVKLAAVKAHLEDGLTSSQAMKKYNIKSKSAFFRWCATYRSEGAEALVPQKRGRPPKNA